jgi:molybdopterin-containing oxidoreductase family iron-sulfur binding subunit
MSQHKSDEFKLPEWSEKLADLSEVAKKGHVTIHFPDGSEPLSIGRRDFLKVASATAAATGLTAAAGCRHPQDKIVPYVDRPEEIYHGVPNTFATVCRGCSLGCGALMTVREGRVVKVDGNPDHPLSNGALCSLGQASPLDVFSPDRVRGPLKLDRKGGAGTESTWEALDKEVIAALSAAKNKKVRLLTGPGSGPAQAKLIKEFLSAFADAKHIQWEVTEQSANLNAHQEIYGGRFEPFYRFDKAKTIVSFGSEFLDSGNGSVNYIRQFTKGRDPNLGDDMSHFIAFEGRRTLTGSAADTRYRVRTSDLLYVALAVAAELAVDSTSKLVNDPMVKTALSGFTADKTGPAVGLSAEAIKKTVAELKAAGKDAVVVSAAGGGGEDETRLAMVAALINELIGAVGTTVEFSRVMATQSNWADFQALHAELEAGQVDVLIVSGINPAYGVPASLKMGEALGKAGKLIVVDTMLSETAAKADWFAAASHWLEAWGDNESLTGTYTVQQPGMMPLHKTRCLEDSLIEWGKGVGLTTFKDAVEASAGYKDPLRRPSPGAWYFYLTQFWKGDFYKKLGSPTGGDAFWEAVTRKGLFVDRNAKYSKGAFKSAAFEKVAPARPEKATDAIELELYVNSTVYDGRGATNPLLIEQPDTITKNSWGNCACVAPSRFKALGLKKLGDIVKISVEGAEIEVPVMIIPGMHSNVVALQLGYGRTDSGLIADGVGQNAYPLTQANASGLRLRGIPATIEATGGFEELGMPRQANHVLHPERHLVPHTTLEEYKKDKSSGAEWHDLPSFFGDDHKYPELKWGMAIDLSKCLGCSACLTACSVENNIPIVGKQGVLEGRLMHWLRIDRYYALPKQLPEGKENYDAEMLTASPLVAAADYLEDPQMLIQPTSCQHCDNAPCETVCPVAATVHSSDGLNEQVYNRCVGTRYCANNCPYKVRRFNWYNYNKDRSEEFIAQVFPEVVELGKLNARWPQELSFNPEVTVRSRGVMEKCTWCVQRLRKHTLVHKKLGIEPKAPQTACQQSCAAGAITFGNTADPNSAVSSKFKEERAFALLSSVGTKPSVRYMTKVRNTKKS